MSAPASNGDSCPDPRLGDRRRDRLRPAPPWQPPYDDDRPPTLLRVVADELPFDTWAIPEPVAEPLWEGLDDPTIWARMFLQAALEAIAGRRAPRQLERWTTPAVFEGLRRTSLKAAAGPPRPASVVRSVRAMEPVHGVAEISAVTARGAPGPTRMGAIAARLEARHGQWRCVVLQIG